MNPKQEIDIEAEDEMEQFENFGENAKLNEKDEVQGRFTTEGMIHKERNNPGQTIGIFELNGEDTIMKHTNQFETENGFNGVNSTKH